MIVFVPWVQPENYTSVSIAASLEKEKMFPPKFLHRVASKFPQADGSRDLSTNDDVKHIISGVEEAFDEQSVVAGTFVSNRRCREIRCTHCGVKKSPVLWSRGFRL